jgi:DNA-binding beta-propeller fold protein YncE
MDGQFKKPRAIATNAEDHHYIVDFRAKIQAFTTDGKLLAAWQTPDHGLGRPSGLAFDREGNLHVADSHYHQILVYTPMGELVRVFGGESGRWPLTGEFGYIGDIAIDSKGCLYIAESQQNERITKLTPDYQIAKRWGGRGNEPGQFMRIRSLCFNAQDQVFVADACNHRIQVFDTHGNLLRIIGEPGTGPGQLQYPYDVAIAPDGSFYVCEYGNHRVQRFSAEGEPLGTWGKPGRGEGELWNPWALSVASDGRVVVVDSNNHRIQIVTF